METFNLKSTFKKGERVMFTCGIPGTIIRGNSKSIWTVVKRDDLSYLIDVRVDFITLYYDNPQPQRATQ